MHAFELQFELCNSAGSSLAQDRGRLESKIEALNSEVTILKKNLEVKLSRKITLSVLSLINRIDDVKLSMYEFLQISNEDVLIFDTEGG